MSVTFRRAVRENVGLVIGVAGPSGSGKTWSGMALADGIARALGTKPFAVVDTENRRALHYSDAFTFDHCDLAPPFSPDAYAEAIKAADVAGYPVICVDTASHGHAGEGGLLDMHEAELLRMAGDDWKKREAVKMSAWIRPKQSQKRFVQQLLRTRAHVVLTFRAEQKVDVIRDKDGKMQVVPKKIMSGFSDWIPVAEKNLLYELTASFLLTPDAPGVPKPIKIQSQHRPFFPLDKPIARETGELLAAWAAGGTGATTPPSLEAEERAALLAKITELGKAKHEDVRRALWTKHVGATVKKDDASLDALRNLRDELQRSVAA